MLGRFFSGVCLTPPSAQAVVVYLLRNSNFSDHHQHSNGLQQQQQQQKRSILHFAQTLQSDLRGGVRREGMEMWGYRCSFLYLMRPYTPHCSNITSSRPITLRRVQKGFALFYVSRSKPSNTTGAAAAAAASAFVFLHVFRASERIEIGSILMSVTL